VHCLVGGQVSNSMMMMMCNSFTWAVVWPRHATTPKGPAHRICICIHASTFVVEKARIDRLAAACGPTQHAGDALAQSFEV
jgi:hypothetical protein